MCTGSPTLQHRAWQTLKLLLCGSCHCESALSVSKYRLGLLPGCEGSQKPHRHHAVWAGIPSRQLQAESVTHRQALLPRLHCVRRQPAGRATAGKCKQSQTWNGRRGGCDSPTKLCCSCLWCCRWCSLQANHSTIQPQPV